MTSGRLSVACPVDVCRGGWKGPLSVPCEKGAGREGKQQIPMNGRTASPDSMFSRGPNAAAACRQPITPINTIFCNSFAGQCQEDRSEKQGRQGERGQGGNANARQKTKRESTKE